ncbi:MAG: cation transporter, partial [Candidatus ainarchaeum sp.]|nr:cation transporter [Candidatus ainarchaeum sp.]
MEKKTLNIEGMDCASCAMGIEKALKRTRGVLNASVNYANGKAYVEYNPGELKYAEIEKKISGLGYGVV